jgi:hypothetical protein
MGTWTMICSNGSCFDDIPLAFSDGDQELWQMDAPSICDTDGATPKKLLSHLDVAAPGSQPERRFFASLHRVYLSIMPGQ